MFLYLNSKTSKKLNEDVILSSIVSYIIIIAYIKYIERKNNLNHFFDMYIILIFLLDILFSSFVYLKRKIKDIKFYETKINTDNLNTYFDIYSFNDDFFNKINKKINLEIKKNMKSNITPVSEPITENN